jgi:hypothetical protein
MNVIVQLADIFNMTSLSVMEQRVKKAFDAGSKDFWEQFFRCDHFYPNDMVVHLFTEHQLEFLWNWWNQKIAESDNAKKNLDYSGQKQFRTVRRTPDGRYVDRTRACYATFIGSTCKLKRLFFGVPPGVIINENSVDFFRGGFKGETLENDFTDDMRRERIMRLLALRPELEREFGGPRRNDTKWMHYLGPKLFDHKLIDYCTGLNCDCSLKDAMHLDNSIKIGNT